MRLHYDMTFDLAAGRPKKHGELMRGLLVSGHAPGLGARLGGLRRAIAGMMGMGK